MPPVAKLPPKPSISAFQTTKEIGVDRADHVWHQRENDFICAICGAVTMKPPCYPTSKDWVAGKYEALTDVERAMAPAKK